MAGSVEIDQANEETTVEGPAGPMRVTGTGGRVTIEHPKKEVKVDCAARKWKSRSTSRCR